MKNLRHHLNQLGLLNTYNTNATFALQARMVTALAFVPIHDLDDAFYALSDELPDELEPILNWFEDYYLGRRVGRQRRRRDPQFPPQLWSVYERTIGNEDRTNNHAQAAHRRLQAEINMKHPTIWKFIDTLKHVQRGRDQHYEEYVAGNPPKAKRHKYVRADERIQTIVNDYANRTIIEYLRGLAHNFLME